MSSPMPPPTPLPAPYPINRATFAELQESTGADFVAELVGTFAEELPGMLAELHAACAAASAERFRRAAHSLKTNAQSFGALALGEQARALETGGLPADAAPLAALQAACDEALAALRELARG